MYIHVFLFYFSFLFFSFFCYVIIGLPGIAIAWQQDCFGSLVLQDNLLRHMVLTMDVKVLLSLWCVLFNCQPVQPTC